MYQKTIENQVFDQERALYGSESLQVIGCRFDGPADGESAFKECRDIRVADTFFNLRYPFWHDTGLKMENCRLTALCRAALWYSEDVTIENCELHGIKALRECGKITMRGCDVISAEFGWSTRGIAMADCTVQGEYFMLRSENLLFSNVHLKGKYSFQYIENSVFDNCVLDTKDAFWHAKNITVRNSIVKGEYLAWYSENITFENCVICGTQPLCYCKGLKLINCRMESTDLCFEKSHVEATLTAPVDSIKNPLTGFICAPACGEQIWDDPKAAATVLIGAFSSSETARRILQEQDYTCVLCAGNVIHTTTSRGVKPLVQLLHQNTDVAGFSAADKVVGRATAFLYCLLGVSRIYARVISRGALDVLQAHGIGVEYDTLAEYIVNRAGDGMCPFEAAVQRIQDPTAALDAIYKKMEQMHISI